MVQTKQSSSFCRYFCKQIPRTLFFIIAPCITIITLASCNKNINTSSPNNNLWQQHLKSQQEFPAHLGDSYDSRALMPRGENCLVNHNDPNNFTISNQQSDLGISQANIYDLSNKMGVSISDRWGWGNFSSSFPARYLIKARDSRQDLNFNYYKSIRADISYKIPGAGNNILSEYARDILTKYGDDAFLSICGDSIISYAYVGAIIYINIGIHFDTNEHKKVFEESIFGKPMSISRIMVEFKKASASYAKNSLISIAAFQTGGDSEQLAKIVDRYDTIQCSSENIKICENTLNQLIKYALEDLSHQVDFNHPQNLDIFNYSTTEFKKLGVNLQVKDFSQETQQASINLVDSITQDKIMLQYLKKYRQQEGLIKELSIIDIRSIENLIKSYEAMIRKYDMLDILDSCYGTSADTTCKNAWDYIHNFVHPDYKQAIDSATDLSDTLVLNSYDYPEYYYYALVPLSGHCNQQGECSGLYALFAQKTITIDSKTNSTAENEIKTIDYIQDICDVDTTVDNSYFATTPELQKYVGKSVVCHHVRDYSMSKPANPIFVNQVSGSINQGDLGEFINQKEQLKPHARINVLYSGRDGSILQHLKYNPI